MQWTAVSNILVPSIAVAVIAAAAAYSLMAGVPESALHTYTNTRVSIEGEVVRDIDAREHTLRITVRPQTVNGSAISEKTSILVSTDPYVDVRYGDRIKVTGVLKTPEPFETDTGRTFDYPHYLRAHNILYSVSFAEVETVERNTGNAVVSWLFSVKQAFIRGIETALPEPHAALAKGLLLGEKQSLGDALTDAFRKAGVIHIIVLSGYNVAIVITTVLFITLSVLPRAAGYALAALFVVGFTIMTGGAETTIRAAAMALLMMVARVLHRPAAALRGLLIAAAAMALVNPFLVLYDLSFQLSVLATLGLILFSESVARNLQFIPERFGFREVIATTIATQITVLPLLILSTGAVSLVFIPANALVLLPVPLAMLLTFVSAVAALFFPVLGTIIGFAAYLILGYIIAVAEFFGSLPFSSVEIPPQFSWATLGLLFCIYGVWILRFLTRKPLRNNVAV